MDKQLNIFEVAAILACSFILILVVDYFNIPSMLGINIDNFNMDVQSIVINAIVTVSMFLAAYFLIDRWDTHKHKNQQETAEMLLKKTYVLCKKYISTLDDEYLSELSFQLKRGGEINPTSFFMNYEKMPFDHDAIIMQYFSDGTLSSQQMYKYTRIKGLYGIYITLYAVSHESKEKMKVVNDLKSMLLSNIQDAIEELP